MTRQLRSRQAERRRWPCRLAWPVVVTVFVWWFVAWAGAVPSSAGVALKHGPNLDDFTCVLPALPRVVQVSSSHRSELAGPAVSALTGGAARHGFNLDGGGLIVRSPRPGVRPVLTASQALCGAMASTGDLSGPALQGVAVGYGEVTVATRFFPAITSLPFPGFVAAQNPTVKSFTNQLAWLVVVHANPVSFSCPLERAPVRLVPRASDHGYEVFIIDARTGANALIYREGGPGGCQSGARVPPSLGVAEEMVSVPWTLVSRDPDGYSATIAATVLPCDKAPTSVLVDRGSPNVEVQVTRPYGPVCGPPMKVTLGLDAAVVTADLPSVIGHDPVGLQTNLSPAAPAPEDTTSTTTTVPALVQVDASANGHTLALTAGEVVTVLPLPGTQGASLTSPAVSSDPAVLGPLTTSPQPLVAEFRAWQVGTADITVPQSACVHPGSDQSPCSGTFVVYVVVR